MPSNGSLLKAMRHDSLEAPQFGRWRIVVSDLFSIDGERCESGRIAINAPRQYLRPEVAAGLQPFRDQSIPLEFIIAVGCQPWLAGETGVANAPPTAATDEAMLLRLGVGRDADTAIVARIPMPVAAGSDGRRVHTLESLARQARELISDATSEVVLLSPPHILSEMIVRLVDDFCFRGVAIPLSQNSSEAMDGTIWKTQRILFDLGLVGIGCVQIAAGEMRCFAASEAVRSARCLGVGSRGRIAMSSLGNNGRFANQLFQYAYVKLYALRHGLTPAIPAWEGNQLFGLEDASCAGLDLPELRFGPFTRDDLVLWKMDQPPVDVDLQGYFQEIPECWQKHRPLLRRMFLLSAEHQSAFDDWQNEVTHAGRRTLVAVHVRRGDYRDFQQPNRPWFRLIPEEWYIAWLRAVWPSLHDPVLYVATDEPDAILPLFREFESATLSPTAPAIPEHVRDFEILRRADYLAICNSSFSRMAAILAPPMQKCFCPSLQTQSFAPYEPWMDRDFWIRFGTHPSGLRRWANSIRSRCSKLLYR
jgi:hypothetical protein